jgi:hypothetical protein
VTVLKRRGWIYAAIALTLILAVNALAYTGMLNGSSTILNLIKKLNIAYVTPKTYVELAERMQKKYKMNPEGIKQLDSTISEKSSQFITAAFSKDGNTMGQLLDLNTQYVKSEDGSSFIRYIGSGTHVEGYMATDKNLVRAKQRWHILEEDNTVTCSMEVYLENEKAPQLWYLHFRKIKEDWKIYMLENGV